jgi:hypothetical protein
VVGWLIPALLRIQQDWAWPFAGIMFVAFLIGMYLFTHEIAVVRSALAVAGGVVGVAAVVAPVYALGSAPNGATWPLYGMTLLLGIAAVAASVSLLKRPGSTERATLRRGLRVLAASCGFVYAASCLAAAASASWRIGSLGSVENMGESWMFLAIVSGGFALGGSAALVVTAWTLRRFTKADSEPRRTEQALPADGVVSEQQGDGSVHR